jgi:hypothetical protein
MALLPHPITFGIGNMLMLNNTNVTVTAPVLAAVATSRDGETSPTHWC